MTTNPKPRGRGRLRLADPAAPLPDDRAAVARALLDRYVPVDPSVLHYQVLAPIGWSSLGELHELERDPRYLIGRLAQALSGAGLPGFGTASSPASPTRKRRKPPDLGSGDTGRSRDSATSGPSGVGAKRAPARHAARQAPPCLVRAASA